MQYCPNWPMFCDVWVKRHSSFLLRQNSVWLGAVIVENKVLLSERPNFTLEAAWLSGNQQSWSLSKSEITGPREIEGSNPGKAAFRRVLVGITNLGRVPHCSAFAVRA
ncbi:hypothetical protein B0H11DRAFT_2189964 [Mycena galericulata]|nr:hypothetical protein B0H11DRAFT_2189964 [Mycena galericulata]